MTPSRLHPIRFALALIVISSFPGNLHSEPRYIVTKSGFECLVNNASEYFSQGDEIFVDFSDCPLKPDLRERMRARAATNWLPRAKPADVTEAGPTYSELIVISADILACLVAHRSTVLGAADDQGYVAILPDVCLNE